MRVINFSAGPAVLPEIVLQQAAAEMLDWRGSGMSVMEMSHRGKEFISIAAKVEADLRTLLAIPANYKVLFLQGGAVGENAESSADELAACPRRCRLHQHRRMVQEIADGGEEILHGQRRRVGRGPELHLCAAAGELEIASRCGLRACVHQRDDRRCRIPLDAGHRRRPARGGHVVPPAVARDRRFEVRRDLWWRARRTWARRA